MKKENMKIKKNITLTDKINAVESIVLSYFTDGEYTPWYADITEVMAIISYFIEGIEFEDNESLYDCYLKDKDLQLLVDSFFDDKISTDNEPTNFKTLKWVRKQVTSKVDFLKMSIIHAHPNMDKIVELANVIIDSLENFSNINLSALSSEDIELGKKIIKKLSSDDVEITPEAIRNIIRNTAGYDIDYVNNNVINSLKEENKELRKYKILWDSKNLNTDKGSNN